MGKGLLSGEHTAGKEWQGGGGKTAGDRRPGGSGAGHLKAVLLEATASDRHRRGQTAHMALSHS